MSRQRDVETLAVVLAELVDEFRTVTLYEWRPSRVTQPHGRLPKPQHRVHRTVEPGLLEQLRRGPGQRRAVAKPEGLGYDPALGYRAVVDASALVADMAPTLGRPELTGGSRRRPGSRPPAGLHAAETLAELSVAVADVRARVREAAGLDRGRALSVAGMLRELQDLVVRRGQDGAWLVNDVWVRVLLQRARGWASAARVALSYDAPVVELRVVCPVCGGRMLVRSDATSDVWCAGLRGRVKEGPVRPGEVWPLPDRGCGASWPRITWIDLLEQDAG